MVEPAVLFTIVVEIKGDITYLDYESIDDFLKDQGICSLFEDSLVTECSIYCGRKRIAGLPVMEYQRLLNQVISNSSAILESRVPDTRQ